MHERPKFIGLDEVRPHLADITIKNAPTVPAHSHQDSQNRGLVDSRQARNTPHTHAFHEQGYNVGRLLEIEAVLSERLPAGGDECRTTRPTVVSLDFLSAVGSEFSGGFVLAFRASHFGLPFFQR